MNAKQLVSVLMLTVCALLVGGGVWFLVSVPISDDAATVDVSIADGAGVSEIGEELESEGVVRSGALFGVYARFSGRSRLLRAGTYTLPLNLSMREVVQRLATGEGSEDDVTVTIPEGFNNTQVFTALVDAELPITAEEFSGVTARGFSGDSSDFIYDGKPEEVDLTGYLFPDTYNFYSDSTAAQVVEKMVDNFKSKITADLRAKIEASPYSFYELLTLASIIEKEVRTPEERRLAAGVFFRRLSDNYPLQSDATLNFVTGKKETRASASDLTIDSPYNSYTHVGLPPTPIANPGLESIRAVLDPAQTEYYFFLTTPEGKAVFSRTLEEHNRQKAIYYP